MRMWLLSAGLHSVLLLGTVVAAANHSLQPLASTSRQRTEVSWWKGRGPHPMELQLQAALPVLSLGLTVLILFQVFFYSVYFYLNNKRSWGTPDTESTPPSFQLFELPITHTPPPTLTTPLRVAPATPTAATAPPSYEEAVEAPPSYREATTSSL